MRTCGAAPRRLAQPLTVDEIRTIVDVIDRTSPIGIRDAAMILLGYASAMRRSEIVTRCSPGSGRARSASNRCRDM